MSCLPSMTPIFVHSRDRIWISSSPSWRKRGSTADDVSFSFLNSAGAIINTHSKHLPIPEGDPMSRFLVICLAVVALLATPLFVSAQQNGGAAPAAPGARGGGRGPAGP